MSGVVGVGVGVGVGAVAVAARAAASGWWLGMRSGWCGGSGLGR